MSEQYIDISRDEDGEIEVTFCGDDGNLLAAVMVSKSGRTRAYAYHDGQLRARATMNADEDCDSSYEAA